MTHYHGHPYTEDKRTEASDGDKNAFKVKATPVCTGCGHQHDEGMYTLYSKDYIKTAEQPFRLVGLLPGF